MACDQVKILLEQKADPHECDEDGWNCLHFCAWNAGKKGSAQCAELLLEAGARVMERVSVCHAEEDDQMDRRGDMASGIVKRRMKLMSEVETENAKCDFFCVLLLWALVVLGDRGVSTPVSSDVPSLIRALAPREMLAVLKKYEDITLEKIAKAQAKAKDKAQYESAMENAKRRTSIREKRKPSITPTDTK